MVDPPDDCTLELDQDINGVPSFYQKVLMSRKRRKNRERMHPITTHQKVRRSAKKRSKHTNDVDKDGVYRKMDPKQTYWYKNYVLFPNLACRRFNKIFRIRFRLPHNSFLSLLETVSKSTYFMRWDENNIIRSNRERSPMSLLLL